MAVLVGRSTVDFHEEEKPSLLPVMDNFSNHAPGMDLPPPIEMQKDALSGVLVDIAQPETQHDKEDDHTMEQKRIGGPLAEPEKVTNGNFPSKTAKSNTAKSSDAMDPKSEISSSVLPNSEFTIEASVWPTLAEARNQKPSKHEVLKSAPAKLAEVVLPTTTEKQNILLETQKSGKHPASPLPSAKQKSAYRRGNMPAKLIASENVPIHQNQIPSPNVKYAGKKSSFAGSHRVYNQNAYNSAVPKWHNNVRLHGNGHPGWQYGYGNGHSYNYFFAPHEHQFIPLNVQQPFVNIPPAYYNIPNFQVWQVPPNHGNYLPYVPSTEGPGVHEGQESTSIETALQRQIEYYFSNENLPKDNYLRSIMDSEGFVPISVIAKFNRVRSLTSNLALIFEALRKSSLIEVKEDKIRRAHDWQKFLITSQSYCMGNELGAAMQDSIQQLRNDATSLRSKEGSGAIADVETKHVEVCGDFYKAHASPNGNKDHSNLSLKAENGSLTNQLRDSQPIDPSIEYESGICSSPRPQSLLMEENSSTIETLCTSLSCLTSSFPNKKDASRGKDLVERQLGSCIAA